MDCFIYICAVQQKAADWSSPYKFNAKEQDDLTGMYYYGARYYDPRISVWHGVDPLAEMYPDWSTYGYTMNNPITYIDPNGMSTDNGGGDDNVLPQVTITAKRIKENANVAWNSNAGDWPPENGSKGQTHTDSDGSFVHDGNGWQDKSGAYVLPTVEINGCPTCLDKTTTHKNLMGLTYPGGDNPYNYNKSPSYEFVPESLAEYPAIGHDRRYDRLKTAGLMGLLTDTRAIGADWKFVQEQLIISAIPYHKDRNTAAALGIGLGFLASFKTMVQLSKPGGYQQIKFWYNYSNIGVTNSPSKTKK